MELRGTHAVLTGASRGIGQALARGLARSGCSLALTALEADELAALVSELRAFGATADGLACDLSDRAERERFLAWLAGAERPPDLLVNNAGLGHFGRFGALNLASVEREIAVNVASLVHLTHALLPTLAARPAAMVVNVSSGMARLPYAGLAVYGGTKGFVSSFSESLACDLAGTRVRVLCVHAGFTRTAFMASAGMDMRRVPRFMVHEPERVAAAVVRAIRRDAGWTWSDALSRLGAALGHLLPHRLRVAVFKGLFWRLPDER